MANGSQKEIQSLLAGDLVDSPNADKASVVLVDTIAYQGIVYGINGDASFVTPTHPFLTTQGWKAFDPINSMKEHPEMSIGKLQIGDTILTKEGARHIYQLSTKNVNTKVYNLTLSTGHTYYANDYQVHNFYNVANGVSVLGSLGSL